MLIVHEVMGRNSGWLTAATALAHHRWVRRCFAESAGELRLPWDVHGVVVPEGHSTSLKSPGGCEG